MSHAQNMYRVGDFVYFEVSANAPYQVRKIEDLNKTASGQVEARVTLYYRRRDVSSALLKIADQAERRFDEYYEVDKLKPDNYGSSGHTIVNGSDLKEEDKEDREIIMTSDNAHVRKDEEEDKSEWGSAGLPLGADALDTRARHRLRQRELFLSRQVETLPATQIRGKCHVTLLSEIETPDSYDQEDSFFYSLVYDPTQMTLLADKGAIRVGEKYQADVPETMENNVMGESDENKENGNGALMIDESVEDETSSESRMLKETEREVVVYHPHHSLTDRDMDQFLIIARAVGTFSRALDTSSSTKLPSLHMTAAAASRDVTLFHAMALLHQAGYDIGQATKFLVPPPNKSFYPLEADKATGHNTVSLGGPILCRDQMEEWSAAEANLFEEAMEKYGKDFSDVRSDFLPWKSIRDIVEYYYMWKTTNRYVEQKKKKHAEQESKLKQVYIPNFNRVNPTAVVKGTDPCEGCKCTDASGWFAWGPAHLNLRLCQDCWTMWKKNGGLRDKHEYETYDLDGAANEAVNDVRPVTSTVNPMSINKNSAAAQNRPVVSGQVVARLPPNHPHAHAISGSISGTMGKQQLKGPFTMVPSLMYRIARRVCPRSLLNLRMAARRPSLDINATAIKNFCYSPDAVSVVLAAARHIKQLRHHTLSPNFAQNYTIQQAHHIQQQAATKRPASSAGNEPPLKKEKLLRAADGIVPLPIVLPTPTLPSLRTHPVAHKSDSRWRCSSGQLVFVAGPKFRRRRLEIIPRGQLARRLARRPFVSEHQTTLSNSMSALASYLPSDTFNSSTPSIEYNSNAMIFGPLP